MARMRTLKPEFWTDEELACQLTRDERLLYLGLWNLADEHARLRGNPSYIKGQLLAYDDDITVADIERMLARLAELGKVRPYTVGVGRYLFLPNLAKHQRLDADKVPSRLPSPDQAGRDSDEPDPDPDPPGSDPDKSGRDPDILVPDPETSVLKHVAGSRGHVAGGMAAAATREHARGADPSPPPQDPVITELRERLGAARLTVRWDKLTPDQLGEISALINLHGVARLVQAASREYQPNSPPAFAQAWLPGWRALPPPGQSLHAVTRKCSTHLLEEPCRGCAADRKAAS